MDLDLDKDIFDRIRLRRGSGKPREAAGPSCEREGCAHPGLHRAPKGRGREGQYWRFCLDHVREYNHNYNYFAGMSDDAVVAYQKDAVIGHRPTWAMGTGRPEGRKADGPAPARDWEYLDPLGILRAEGAAHAKRAAPEPPVPRASGPVRHALDVLGLDEGVDAATIKAQYKILVKRFHPDAHGGDRSYEARLRDIIRAHDTLRAAGRC
jgi:hypothetical protein